MTLAPSKTAFGLLLMAALFAAAVALPPPPGSREECEKLTSAFREYYADYAVEGHKIGAHLFNYAGRSVLDVLHGKVPIGEAYRELVAPPVAVGRTAAQRRLPGNSNPCRFDYNKGKQYRVCTSVATGELMGSRSGDAWNWLCVRGFPVSRTRCSTGCPSDMGTFPVPDWWKSEEADPRTLVVIKGKAMREADLTFPVPKALRKAAPPSSARTGLAWPNPLCRERKGPVVSYTFNKKHQWNGVVPLPKARLVAVPDTISCQLYVHRAGQKCEPLKQPPSLLPLTRRMGTSFRCDAAGAPTHQQSCWKGCESNSGRCVERDYVTDLCRGITCGRRCVDSAPILDANNFASKWNRGSVSVTCFQGKVVASTHCVNSKCHGFQCNH